MELPRLGRSDRGGGVLDGIKSKLGFASDAPDDFDEEYYRDDNYEYEDDYDDYADDAQSGAYVPSTVRTSSSVARAGRNSNPPLVSIDDVRSRTQVPDSLNRDPLPERRVSASQNAIGASSTRSVSSFSGRRVERAADYLRSTDTSDVTGTQEADRSSGYNSLFVSTEAPNPATTSSAAKPAAAFDPYEAYAGSGVSSHNPSRSLNVLKPMSYGEVERIAKTIKAGDVVILSLRNTPDQLAKRILDFSFGVSSALDASVECIADKVFAVIRGRELNDDEKTQLRNQGVI